LKNSLFLGYFCNLSDSGKILKKNELNVWYEKLDKKDVKNRYLDLLEVLGESSLNLIPDSFF
jgi:hypothetical protein